MTEEKGKQGREAEKRDRIEGKEREMKAETARKEGKRREREAQQGWFESWFQSSQSSPWLTTLLSSLVGLIIILLLLLTFGPCILNKLLAFIKQRLNTVQLMVLRQQYQGLPTSTPSQD